MTEIVNANGSVTYSADAPGPIQIEADGSLYRVRNGGPSRGEQYIVEDAEQASSMRLAAAELIAVADAYDRVQEVRSTADRDRLAEVLYAAEQYDADAPLLWAGALPATKRKFENRASRLRTLGVTVGA